MISKKKSLACLELSGILTKGKHFESKTLEKSSTKCLERLQSKHPGTPLIKRSDKFVPIPELGIYTADQHVLQNGTFPQHCYSARETIHHQKLDNDTTSITRDTQGHHQKQQLDSVNDIVIRVMDNHHFKSDLCSHSIITRDSDSKCHATTHQTPQTYHSSTNVSRAAATHKRTNSLGQQYLYPVNQKPKNKEKGGGIVGNVRKQQIIQPIKTLETVTNHKTDPPKKTRSLCDLRTGLTFSFVEQEHLQIGTVLDDDLTAGRKFQSPSRYKSSSPGSCKGINSFQGDKWKRAPPIHKASLSVYHPPQQTSQFGKTQTPGSFVAMEAETKGICQKQAKQINLENGQKQRLNERQTSSRKTCSPRIHLVSSQWRRANSDFNLSNSGSPRDHRDTESSRLKNDHSVTEMNRLKNGRSVSEMNRLKIDHTGANRLKHDHSVAGTIPNHTAENNLKLLKHSNHRSNSNELLNCSDNSGLMNTSTDNRKADNEVTNVDNDKTDHEIFRADSHCPNNGYSCHKVANNCCWTGSCRMASPCCRKIFSDARSVNLRHGFTVKHSHDDKTTDFGVSCSNDGERLSLTQHQLQQNLDKSCHRPNKQQHSNIYGLRNNKDYEEDDCHTTSSNVNVSHSVTCRYLRPDVGISLFDLTQKFDLVPVLVQLPQGILLKDVLQLKEVSISGAHHSPQLTLPHMEGALQSPEARMPHIGNPASAFTPVKPRSEQNKPATLGPRVVYFSSVEDRVHEYTSVGRAMDGDILCEVNGRFCLGSDYGCLKEVVENCRGFVTFTVARAKPLHEHKLPDQEDRTRIQELECDVTRLNILIQKREEQIQDLVSAADAAAATAAAAAASRNLLTTLYTEHDDGASRELLVCDVDVGYEEYVV